MSKYNNIKTYLSPKCNKNKLESLYEICNNKENNHFYKVDKEKDKRLSFTLSILGLNNMINLFNEKNITFIDLLLLSKESMKELELEMYQRNRIYNFSTSFTKFAKNYSMDELLKFFDNHKQFLFIKEIYENKITTNKNDPIINKSLDKKKYLILNDENKNINNYDTPRYNIDPKLKKKVQYSTNKKCHRGKNILKKYLSLKKDVDEFLNKLNKHKEDTQILSYKYGNFFKKINIYERNEDDIMISKEYNINKKININKILEKIKYLENKKIDQKTFEYLNQIKNFLIEKGYDSKIEEIIKFQNEIEKMIELNLKKEQLKNNLEICEKKINEKRNLIEQLDSVQNNNNSDYN